MAKKRKDQLQKIQDLDDRLKMEHSLVKLDGQKHWESIRNNVSPWWLVGGGLALGVVIGALKGSTQAGLFGTAFKGLRIWHLAHAFSGGSGMDPEIDA
ncbi:hypothetical protein SAMN05216421_0139 [Halopseudomonas xinjiangensis]|uniref:Uncharacterized protein n=2 Tax=Halopseudomonas xinjiangensis TaxID=487184 RepID=A0A1H1LE45_9GAMM|nr:hypothetical protein SAMN05216421_0139 [Halopseudomonas xinjiangensis]